jgi:hypothetical protein
MPDRFFLLYRLDGACGRLVPPPPVLKWICVIIAAIGAHQQRKHMVSSVCSVAIA